MLALIAVTIVVCMALPFLVVGLALRLIRMGRRRDS
jgi:hypothetical protein